MYRIVKMNRFSRFALLMMILLLTSSCAVSYHSIGPQYFNYPTPVTEDGISVSYKYDVFRSTGNRRYAEKELNQGLHMIAIQITNQSDTTIRLSRDCNFYAGNISVLPLDTHKQEIRQRYQIYKEPLNHIKYPKNEKACINCVGNNVGAID
jgi:hypothetical protein